MNSVKPLILEVRLLAQEKENIFNCPIGNYSLPVKKNQRNSKYIIKSMGKNQYPKVFLIFVEY